MFWIHTYDNLCSSQWRLAGRTMKEQSWRLWMRSPLCRGFARLSSLPGGHWYGSGGESWLACNNTFHITLVHFRIIACFLGAWCVHCSGQSAAEGRSSDCCGRLQEIPAQACLRTNPWRCLHNRRDCAYSDETWTVWEHPQILLNLILKSHGTLTSAVYPFIYDKLLLQSE